MLKREVSLVGYTSSQQMTKRNFSTREDCKPDVAASSQSNKERLEAKFRNAISLMYEAFKEACILENSELIENLRDNLVKPAIAQITSLFTSSWCRTCYSGRHQTAAWRQSRFDTLAPLLCEVPQEAYKKAEDHHAVIIIEKTKIDANGPPFDRFRLGLSQENRRIYAMLTRLEHDSFNDELKNLVNINSLIRMSRRWDSQKDNPPSLEVNLNHDALEICQLQHQKLLPIARLSFTGIVVSPFLNHYVW